MAVGRCLILGCGVFGVTAALALRRRGWDVVVVDRGPVPHPEASSTDISKFVRPDYGRDTDWTGWMEAALPRWEAWNHELGPVFFRTGLLVLSSGTMTEGSFEHDSWTTLTARGHRLERLRGTLQTRFDSWSKAAFRDGYFNPAAGWARSGEVVARLAARARADGVVLQLGTRAHALVTRGGRVVGARVGDADLRADVTVVAAGAWSAELVPELGDRIAVVGQPVVHLKADPTRFGPERFPCWAADIAHTGWYGFPAGADGVLKLANHGAGWPVRPGDPLVVPSGWVSRARAFLRGAVPELADAPLLATRCCLYADSVDGDPWIDRHPERPGLVVAAGGSGHAFKAAPLLGDWIADAVEERPGDWRRRLGWRAVGPRRSEQARAGAT